MTRYEKNIKVISKHYEEFDVLLEEGKRNLENDLMIFEETSYDGNQILKVKKEGRILYLSGKRNSQEPVQLWVKWLQSVTEIHRNTTILIMGTGNPLYLEELVNQIEEKLVIIVYEPSLQIFLKFLEMVDLEEWMDKHTVLFWVNGLRDMDLQHLQGIINQTLSYDKLISMRYLIVPNYDELFPEETVGFMKICTDTARVEMLRYNTKHIFSEVIVKNVLSNAKHLYSAYMTSQIIDVIPDNIPGILVAAGPSLNKNIKELKKAKNKSFMIAVDTAIKPLLQEGIIPDLLMTIDGMKPLELFQADGVKDIPLVAPMEASNEVLDYHTGMKFFYSEGYHFLEKVFLESGQIMGKVHSGGSVATNAFSLFYMLGIDTIILVGQDLAYTNNKSHADGTFHEVMEEYDTSAFRMIEGNYEEKVPTMASFMLYIDWYEKYIQKCKEHKNKIGKEFRVINATEGGAKINGTEIMTLKDAIQEVCTKEINISESLQQLKPMFSNEKQQKVKEYLMNIPKDFHRLSLQAGKAEKLYQKLDQLCSGRNINKKEYLNLLKKLKKSRREIEKIGVYELISMTMTRANYILSEEQYLSEDTLQKEGKEIARKGILYMKNVEKLSDLFGEYTEEIYVSDHLDS